MEQQYRLRDLIRSVRQCKTAAEERAVIAKESARIRQIFADENSKNRHRCVAKLLFIQMMGYPTQFGQMECIKLIVSGNFTEKRVGYLGLTQLLNETNDVIMMVTNSIHSDLNNKNPQISSLALTAIANVGTTDMCRDLATDVANILQQGTGYLKKRAALAAVRILRKCPEMVENFVGIVPSLLDERNHGVVLSAVELFYEILKAEPSQAEEFKRSLPVLIRMLRNLLLSGYSPEHDIAGITDPFLQASILKLMSKLGQLGAGSDDLNDTLAQVATNTEGAKNTGNAILYECVKTILGIGGAGGLRVLATNIMGRFLAHRDNNLRYVALKTLQQLVIIDIQAVQRHKNIIVECLKDTDAAIRRKALELTYQIINEVNVTFIVTELLDHLSSCSIDFKEDLVRKICTAIELHSQDKKWYIDTLIKVLSLAGNYVSDESISSALNLISSTNSVVQYSVCQIYGAMRDNMNQLGLLMLGIWCIGEFGDILMNQSIQGVNKTYVVDYNELSQTIQNISQLQLSYTCQEFFILAMAKLSVRVPQLSQPIMQQFEKYNQSLDVETQQRACEFTQLLLQKWDQMRGPIFERMPEFVKQINGSSDVEPTQPIVEQIAVINKPQSSEFTNLIDLDDIITPQSGSIDQIFNQNPFNTNEDEFESAETHHTLIHEAYTDDQLTIKLNCIQDQTDSKVSHLEAHYVNNTNQLITDVRVMAQAHKHIKLSIFPISSPLINPQSHITQTLRTQNTSNGQKPIVIRIKIDFTIMQESYSKTVTIDNLPVSQQTFIKWTHIETIAKSLINLPQHNSQLKWKDELNDCRISPKKLQNLTLKLNKIQTLLRIKKKQQQMKWKVR